MLDIAEHRQKLILKNLAQLDDRGTWKRSLAIV